MTKNQNTNNTQNNVQNVTIRGYDNSFLLVSIAAVNFINAFLKLNNTDLSKFSITDSGFLLPVVTLIFTSIDILMTFKGINRDWLSRLAKWFSVLSILFSGTIFLFDVLIFCKVFAVNSEGIIEIVGNVINYFLNSNLSMFNQVYLLVGYFIAATFQCIASVFRIFYNKKQK